MHSGAAGWRAALRLGQRRSGTLAQAGCRSGCTVREVRRPIYLLALVSLAAAVTGCGSGFAFSPALPQPVQRAIAKDDPTLAYFPTRLPSGYHYAEHFSNRPNDFGLSFSNPREMHSQLGYHVREAHCPGGAMHIFGLNGAHIRWSGTYEDQQAWRCLTSDNVSFVISASRSISGDSVLNTPRRFHDAMVLARVVANIKHIG